jgi:hypothetical protein
MKSAQHKRRHNLGTVRKTTARVGDYNSPITALQHEDCRGTSGA